MPVCRSCTELAKIVFVTIGEFLMPQQFHKGRHRFGNRRKQSEGEEFTKDNTNSNNSNKIHSYGMNNYTDNSTKHTDDTSNFTKVKNVKNNVLMKRAKSLILSISVMQNKDKITTFVNLKTINIQKFMAHLNHLLDIQGGIDQEHQQNDDVYERYQQNENINKEHVKGNSHCHHSNIFKGAHVDLKASKKNSRNVDGTLKEKLEDMRKDLYKDMWKFVLSREGNKNQMFGSMYKMKKKRIVTQFVGSDRLKAASICKTFSLKIKKLNSLLGLKCKASADADEKRIIGKLQKFIMTSKAHSDFTNHVSQVMFET